MRRGLPSLLILLAALATLASAQTPSFDWPKHVTAGKEFSVETTGNGKAVLYIIGVGQVVGREVTLGGRIVIAADELHNAGHYTAILAGNASEPVDFDVLPQAPESLSFLAKPSRVAVGLHDGISGVAYVFDSFQNLVLAPTDVSFQLSVGGAVQRTISAVTRDGVAWVRLDSAPKAGAAQFDAHVDGIVERRIVQQVPGDPCSVHMSARKAGELIEVETDPLRDCKGNAVPDGTIVTFTERNDGAESTVDAPLKRGIARADLPEHDGAVISVATGVVLGNEIRWRQ